jgi:hypothetical protein
MELVHTFKKIINKLNKQEDEAILSKKRKREDKEHMMMKHKEGQEGLGKKKMNKGHHYANLMNNNMEGFPGYKNPYEFLYQQESLKNQNLPPEMLRMNSKFKIFKKNS